MVSIYHVWMRIYMIQITIMVKTDSTSKAIIWFQFGKCFFIAIRDEQRVVAEAELAAGGLDDPAIHGAAEVRLLAPGPGQHHRAAETGAAFGLSARVVKSTGWSAGYGSRSVPWARKASSR